MWFLDPASGSGSKPSQRVEIRRARARLIWAATRRHPDTSLESLIALDGEQTVFHFQLADVALRFQVGESLAAGDTFALALGVLERDRLAELVEGEPGLR